jgi:hypothetical protein
MTKSHNDVSILYSVFNSGSCIVFDMKYSLLDFIEYHQRAVVFQTVGVVIAQNERSVCDICTECFHWFMRGEGDFCSL